MVAPPAAIFRPVPPLCCVAAAEPDETVACCLVAAAEGGRVCDCTDRGCELTRDWTFEKSTGLGCKLNVFRLRKVRVVVVVVAFMAFGAAAAFDSCDSSTGGAGIGAASGAAYVADESCKGRGTASTARTALERAASWKGV